MSCCELIRRQFPEHFIGQAFFDEMARIYSASRVVFNRSIGNDVNMRVFEAVACGSMLVTNDLAENGQDAQLFETACTWRRIARPGRWWRRSRYYLAHEDEREAIAAAGRAEAIARHTYRHRMERLLAEAERRLGRTVVAGSGPDPSRPEGCPQIRRRWTQIGRNDRGFQMGESGFPIADCGRRIASIGETSQRKWFRYRRDFTQALGRRN